MFFLYCSAKICLFTAPLLFFWTKFSQVSQQHWVSSPQGDKWFTCVFRLTESCNFNSVGALREERKIELCTLYSASGFASYLHDWSVEDRIDNFFVFLCGVPHILFSQNMLLTGLTVELFLSCLHKKYIAQWNLLTLLFVWLFYIQRWPEWGVSPAKNDWEIKSVRDPETCIYLFTYWLVQLFV